MRDSPPPLGRLVAVCGALLPLLWLGLHWQSAFGTQNGLIRGVMSLAFATLILLRPKAPTHERKTRGITPFYVAAGIGLGSALAVTGLLVPIRHLEWLGILLLAVASLARGLPTYAHRDILAAAGVLYWAAPVPSAFFTWLQATMQTLSVQGAAWLLHIFNGRVWANGFLLYTPAHVFEVPAWCSGMRTATTVLIVTIALAILKRLPLLLGTLLTLVGLFNALALNVLRIVTMVTFSRLTGSDAGQRFLHDSASVIVLAAVLLVYVEISVARRIVLRRRILAGDTYPDQLRVISQYPPFWRRLIAYRWRLAAGLAGMALAAVLAYRSRPYHRAMMLKDVAIGLRDKGQLDTAQVCGHEIMRLVPNDDEWRFATIRLLLIRGQHQAVIDALDRLGNRQQAAHDLQARILRAYALMSLGRIADAAAIVTALPERLRQEDPRVAMILAEMALRGGKIDDVAVHVVTAAGWTPNIGRIRNLYPYLRVHRRWQAIAASDIPVPYTDPIQTYSILEAYMNLDNVPRVAAITAEGMQRWPADPRLLEPLFFMALKRGDGQWEDRFVGHFQRAVRAMDNPDRLYELFAKCVQLARPDLIWMLYRRIEAIDPSHPALGMSIAVYGHRWFLCRKRHLGLAAATSGEALDLRPYFLLGRRLTRWAPLLRLVPAGASLAEPDTVAARKRFLQTALSEFQAREQQGTLSLDMQYLYVRAMEMAGDVDGARAELAAIVSRHPTEAFTAKIALSEVYERQADWVNVYETLHNYLTAEEDTSVAAADTNDVAAAAWDSPAAPATTGRGIRLLPLLRLGRAQIELRLGIAALHTGLEAVKRYPYATQARGLLARAMAGYDSPEEALFLLSKPRVRNQPELDLMEAAALYETERFNRVEDFCRKHLIPVLRVPSGMAQRLTLPPAELAVLWHLVAVPSEASLADTAATIRHNLPGTPSPALRAMMETFLQAHANGCKGALGRPSTWEALGRDRVEKAIALHQLTVLLCREERFGEALQAALRAVALLPEVPLLHRIVVSLAGADAQSINQARAACPNDPELWLAELVMRTQQSRADDARRGTADADMRAWLRESIVRAVRGQTFSPATMVRAGDYLYRGNWKDEAALAARDATQRARGLLPAFVLGIRCALHSKDEAWALQCTEQAIAASLVPMPDFYRQLVTLKAADGELDTDPDMVYALRQLRNADPDNPLWTQMLGYIRFRRGGWEIVDALFQMSAAIDGGATNQAPYVIAAEAARLLKNHARAADLLRRGLKAHPGNEIMLNNLAYTLAQDADRLDEAAALTPRLELLAGDNLRIVDTLAVIYIRTGQYAKARQAITRIFQNAVPGSPRWFRARMHLAEIAWREGKPKQAADMLEQILQNSRGISDEDILEANALLNKLLAGQPEAAAPPTPDLTPR
jgi:exosortase/archaeosortase family protein